MWSAVAGFVMWLLGRLFGKPQGPSQEAQAAREAGAADVALKGAQDAEVEIEKASDAGAAVDRAVSDPGELRNIEASDPNNRDNAS